MTRTATLLLLLAALPDGPTSVSPRPDLLVADFEGEDYGDWKVTGTAFGKGPARGTLPGQMPVSGYLGKGLVNSFVGGDGSTGTLTSPPFTVERKYLNFLIGGGMHPGKTCINLLQDGKEVRTAAGPNDRPGGTEQLDWHSWDVGELAGKKVVVQIVDQSTGGWGHINIDHILQSDRPRQARLAQRELTITSRYLYLPVRNGAPKRRMKLLVGEKVAREFEIELAQDKPDFWVSSDVQAFRGQKVRLQTTLPADSGALDQIAQGEQRKDRGTLYREKLRPQFHFTASCGWLNDPNGLVYFDGEYHLFFQHNPYGTSWGNMHWGHAVSKDLLHWQELPLALYPRAFGDWAFSGSGVVDRANTSGFGDGKTPPLVLAYTSTGRGECIAFSKDRGRTWTEYAGNPVVKHTGRDPKLIWHAPSKRWVMAVYNEDGGRSIAFHSSPDLKKWTFQSKIADFFECPDLFALPVSGDEKETPWVLYGADGRYLLGDFDGKKFTPEKGKKQVWYGNFYAAQTFDSAPGGRRVQIGWGQGVTFPGMPFNQQMTVPCELDLRKEGEEVRMFARPVRELESLRGKKTVWKGELKPGETARTALEGELLDVTAELTTDKATEVGLVLRGEVVVYDVKKQQLRCRGVVAPLAPRDDRVSLRVLVDRGSVEVFGNGGRVALSVGAHPEAQKRMVEVFARGGGCVVMLEGYPLRSTWK